MAPDDRDRTDLERLAVHVPDHVVYRDFAEQTVALNLQTGRYHGLNATAGAMLAALRDAPSVAAAAKRLAPEWDVSEDVLLGDLVELCDGLEQRGLLETRTADGLGTDHFESYALINYPNPKKPGESIGTYSR